MGGMDEAEFQRRIEVYVGRDLPDLAHDKERIAAALGAALWNGLVGGLQADRNSCQDLVAWIGRRLTEEWPEVARRLQFEQSGTEEGWFMASSTDP
jgi:hypothetical protein